VFERRHTVNLYNLELNQVVRAANIGLPWVWAMHGNTERDSPNLTVLVVEDVDDARHFMRLELEHLGYLVVEAEDGAKAVELALSERPDIILMDLTLPVMDGLAATAMIRSNEEMRGVPIIAVTAHQEHDFRAEAKASGFDAYVTKPIEITWLDELIKGLLV
jgi:two-component system, cell cycle response regulator DivK